MVKSLMNLYWTSWIDDANTEYNMAIFAAVENRG